MTNPNFEPSFFLLELYFSTVSSEFIPSNQSYQPVSKTVRAKSRVLIGDQSNVVGVPLPSMVEERHSVGKHINNKFNLCSNTHRGWQKKLFQKPDLPIRRWFKPS